MAIFRCKRSGNTVSFNALSDIEQMREHEGYEEVIEELPQEQEAAVEVTEVKVAKRGRPRK